MFACCVSLVGNESAVVRSKSQEHEILYDRGIKTGVLRDMSSIEFVILLPARQVTWTNDGLQLHTLGRPRLGT